MRAWLLLVVSLIAGCRSDNASQADYQLVCSTDGRAFYVDPGAMNVSKVTRVPSADKACAPQVEKPAQP